MVAERLKIKLREFREKRNLTQGQVAMRVGVDRSYITRIEHGQRVPGTAVLFRLAKTLGCRMEDVIEFESES